MMAKHPTTCEIFDEVQMLVAASLGGTILPEEEARLEQLVAQSTEISDLYLNSIFESSVLIDWATHGGLSSEELREIEVRINSDDQVTKSIPRANFPTLFYTPLTYFTSGWPAAYLIATVIFGIGLMIGAFTHVSHPGQIARQSDALPSPSLPLPLVVGQITGMNGCKVIGTDRISPEVALGTTYELASGLMEITYNTGSKVILEGPATYRSEANGGYLSVGKLTGRLEKREERRGEREEKVAHDGKVVRGRWSVGSNNPPSAIRHSPSSNPSASPAPLFTITTPTVTVTDLGTEFGVEVNHGGESGVQVFQGSVRLSSSAVKSSEGFKTLQAGASVRVKRGQQPGTCIVSEENAGNATPFVRKMPTAAPSGYSQTVLSDKPLFYWTFDEPKGPAFEQVGHQSKQWLQPVAGASRSEDTPTGEGRAADFTHGSGCFRSIERRSGAMPGAWAIEFWVRFSGPMSGRPMECLLNAGEEVSHGWESWNPAVVSNFSKSRDDNELALCFRRDSSTGDGPKVGDDRWHHVMFVFFGNKWGFGAADRVDVVFDGKARSITRNDFTSAFDLDGRLVVGAADLDLASPFHGLVDELALYDFSGLTEQQIADKAADIAGRHFRLAENEKIHATSAEGEQKNEDSAGH